MSQTVETLGIYWQPDKDMFLFRINEIESNERKLTKRIILSQIAKIFDLFGWLAPVIITAKIMMQFLWKMNIGWDDPISQPVAENWLRYRRELKSVEDLTIPCCVLTEHATKISLIGFRDASEHA